MLYVGIDPGFTNLGFATLDNVGNLLYSEVVTPKDLGICETAEYLSNLCDYHVGSGVLVMERYAAYQGVTNPASEDILMLIGAIHYAFQSVGYDVNLHRAIDWKIRLAKYLVKTKGFSNPSRKQKLDKEFSMAAATCITGITFKTDHEADACCLAEYGRLTSTGVL
jgi:hypothetical protein